MATPAKVKAKLFQFGERVEKTLANRLTARTAKKGLYAEYKVQKGGLARTKPFRMGRLADWQLSKERLEKAMYYNAEVGLAEGGWDNDNLWRNRVLLTGILAAKLGKDPMAASWLAAGVNLQARKLIARSYTYGYTDQFCAWLKDHEEAITTADGWKIILKTQDRDQVLLYLVTFLHTLGSKKLTPSLLSALRLTGQDGLVNILKDRATSKGLAYKIYSADNIAQSQGREQANRILANLNKRVLHKAPVFAKDPLADQPVSLFYAPKQSAELITLINALPRSVDIMMTEKTTSFEVRNYRFEGALIQFGEVVNVAQGILSDHSYSPHLNGSNALLVMAKRVMDIHYEHLLYDVEGESYTPKAVPNLPTRAHQMVRFYVQMLQLHKMAVLTKGGRALTPALRVPYYADEENLWLSDDEQAILNQDPATSFTSNVYFQLLCDAFWLFKSGKPNVAKALLAIAVKDQDPFYRGLSDRSGPTKLFVGGYGWTGSSAVFDSFLGYPEAEEMPGIGDDDYINEGAESEPMLHQGPASLMSLNASIQKWGTFSETALTQFFNLWVLRANHKSYFEYKTVGANANIASIIGEDSYYRILMKLFYDYIRLDKNPKRKKLMPKILTNFERDIVHAMYPDDETIVLFNNSVNTDKIQTLKLISGRCVYIAVNRNILDQFADQKRFNVFLDTTAENFGETKVEKLNAFLNISEQLNATGAGSYEMINLMFEDWILDADYREKVTTQIFGYYNATFEAENLDPSVSSKNIEMFGDYLTNQEIYVLNTIKAKHPKLAV